VDGEEQHTITADDGSFDSGILNPGDTFSLTFDTPGTSAYYCQIHGGPGGVGMAGTIVVN
jgi:plastocyanin